MRFEALSQHGGIFVWRQGSGDPPSPSTGTMAPRAKWQMRARGTRTFVWRTPSAASVDIIIPGVVGNAAAAGITGAVTQDISIAATVGNAVAAGVTGEASVGFDISIDGIVGNAVAAGTTGALSLDIVVSGVVGNAVAAGISGSVSASAGSFISGNPRVWRVAARRRVAHLS